MDRDTAGERSDEDRLTPADRAQPAGRIVALALGAQLDRYRERAPHLRDDGDAEHLHRARTALRRGRSVARDAWGVVPTEELDLLRALMAEVATATSPARDLDVLLSALPAHLEALPTPLRVGWDELHDELSARRRGEQQALTELLDGPVHRAMLRRWQRLANPYRIGGDDPGPDHLRPAGEVVDERIHSAWRALRRAGRRATSSGRAKDWHRARKRAKRVRYLLDAYGDLHPPGAWTRTSKDLRRLQEGLGELQDLDAGLALLIDAHRGLGADGAMTAGALAAHLATDRSRLLDGVDDAWARFDRPGVRRRFVAALEPPD